MTHPWLWAGFALAVAAILVFDLGVARHRHQEVSTRKALLMVAAYTAVAIAFGGAIFATMGGNSALEYYTAYLLEQSLSLDNVFVWVLIFQHLEVPDDAQEKVLFWGIMGAMAFRGLFIFAGTALIDAFEWLLYLFGAIVIFSGVRLLVSSGAQKDIAKNPVLRTLRRHASVTAEFSGQKFFLRRDGRLKATPLFVALVVIETTDIVFAMDSIPAIFGVTRDPLIVYTSNIFAVLGLRALYFAVAGLVEHLRYLRYGLSLLLLLIGLKMIGGHFIAIPIWLTLCATVAIIGGTIAVSLWARRTASKL